MLYPILIHPILIVRTFWKIIFYKISQSQNMNHWFRIHSTCIHFSSEDKNITNKLLASDDETLLFHLHI